MAKIAPTWFRTFPPTDTAGWRDVGVGQSSRQQPQDIYLTLDEPGGDERGRLRLLARHLPQQLACHHRVHELILAQEEYRLPKFLNPLLKQHLIVLDELGFIPFSSNGAHLIFQLCSTLYERVAMIVTTNLRFTDWTQVFGNEQLTAALLDRLTHHAHILEFVGESFRFRERMQRDVQENSSLAPQVENELP